MTMFASFLLILNLVLMLLCFIAIRKNFSQNKYTENMKQEVEQMIADIQFRTEACVTVLEDKIDTANKAVKAAENRLELINKELAKKESEVVVIDKLMTQNSKKVKKDKEKKEETIKIYSDNPLAYRSLFNDQVLQMHKEGISSSEISKMTGIPMGEVDLIISLNANKTNENETSNIF